MESLQSQQSLAMHGGKPQRSLKPWLAVFVALFVAAAGFAAWQARQLNDQSAKMHSLESSAKDLQTSKDSLQAQLDELTGTNTTGDTTPNADTTKIMAAVDAYVRAPVAAADGKYEFTISKNASGFARVNVGVAEGGGYALTLKKVNGNWTVLFGGQDGPAQEDIDKYGIPSGF